MIFENHKSSSEVGHFVKTKAQVFQDRVSLKEISRIGNREEINNIGRGVRKE